MKTRNVIPIKKFSPFRNYYCYLDMRADDDVYYGDHYFYKYHCHIKYTGTEFRKKDSKYCFILCSVRKSDNNLFMKALKELDAGLTLIRGNEYINTRNELFDIIEKESQHA